MEESLDVGSTQPCCVCHERVAVRVPTSGEPLTCEKCATNRVSSGVGGESKGLKRPYELSKSVPLEKGSKKARVSRPCDNCIAAIQDTSDSQGMPPLVPDATLYCVVCKIFLCPTCNDTLHALPLFRRHERIEATRATRKHYCSTHTDSVVEYWCPQEGQAVCVTCVIAGAHKGHDVQTLEEGWQVEKVRAEKVLSDAGEATATFIQCQKQLEEADQQEEEHAKETVQQIETVFAKLIEAVLSRKETLLLQLHTMKEDTKVKRAAKLEAIREGLEKLASIQQEAEDIMADKEAWLDARDPLSTADIEALKTSNAQGECTGVIWLFAENAVRRNIKSLTTLGRLHMVPNTAEDIYSLAQTYSKGSNTIGEDVAQGFMFLNIAAERGHARAQSRVGTIYSDGLQEAGIEPDEEKAVSFFKRSADQGCAWGQYNMGVMYEKGAGGVTQDITKAVDMYNLAASQRLSSAQRALGLLYEDGIGLPKSEEEAVRLFRMASKSGDMEAKYHLGRMYQFGVGGLDKNEKKAAHLYEAAAEVGNEPKAQFRLGLLYEKGKGVSKDEEMAKEYYLQAARSGEARAMYRLGKMREKGKGCTARLEKAVTWYLKAVEKNSGIAALRLGKLYLKGQGGLPKDEEKAVEMYRIAAREHYFTAQYKLATLYMRGKGKAKNPSKKAVSLLEKASEKSLKAKYQLGLIYEEGKCDVKKDEAKAATLYNSAARAGNRKAQYRLGMLYEEGRGIEKNEKAAASWYSLASDKGCTDARHRLAQMYRDGRGVKKDTGMYFKLSRYG